MIVDITGAVSTLTDIHGLTITYGDGTSDGADPGTAVCRPGVPLAPLHFTSNYQHTYTHPGTYTITFTTAICSPTGTGTVTTTTSLPISVQ